MTVSSNLPVVLLGGGAIAVSLARSLGEAGIRVIALGDLAWDSVGSSRHCEQFVHVGSKELEGRYLEWLSRPPVGEAVLFPCDDESLELVARRRAELEQLGYRPIEANDEVLLAMLDKERTYQLAEQAGVGVPRRFVLESPEDLDRQVAESGIEFPCALKPLHSHLFARIFGAATKVLLAEDRAELERVAREIGPHGLQMMVTEIIPGPEDAYTSLYTYIDERGEPLLQFTKQKLRQMPVGFGLATYHQSVRNDEVARVGLQFCQGIGIRGMACVEFKRDQRDGRYKVIECNHRFTLGSEILRYAGINLPLLAYNRVTGGPAHPIDGYREGVHLWVPLADTRAFLAYRERGELTFPAWVKTLRHRPYFQLLDPADPGPSIELFGRRARRFGRKMLGRVGARQR